MATDPLIRNNVTVVGNLKAAKSMVFVNGLGYDKSFWNRLAPAFADDFRLVLFDHVGSVASNQAYFRENQFRYLNVSGYAADLLEICSALKLFGDTIAVGHSLGAMAALLASIQAPLQFSRLVLIGASPRYADAEGYRGGLSKEDIAATYTALQRDYLGWSKQLASLAMATPDKAHLTNAFAEALARIPPEMMLTVLCSLLQTDHRADLGKVRAPTLAIQARQDCFVPLSVAEYIQAHIPDCQLAVIDAVGHLPHVSAPEEVIAAIRRFIT